MKCYQCGVESPLFRNNEKGVPAIWACRDHVTLPVDEEVEDIVNVVQKSNAPDFSGKGTNS